MANHFREVNPMTTRLKLRQLRLVRVGDSAKKLSILAPANQRQRLRYAKKIATSLSRHNAGSSAFHGATVAFEVRRPFCCGLTPFVIARG